MAANTAYDANAEENRFPAMFYRGKEYRTVNSQEEADSLGPEWTDKPTETIRGRSYGDTKLSQATAAAAAPAGPPGVSQADFDALRERVASIEEIVNDLVDDTEALHAASGAETKPKAAKPKPRVK